MSLKSNIGKIIEKKVDNFFDKLAVKTDEFVDLKGNELKVKLKDLEKELQQEIDKEIEEYFNNNKGFFSNYISYFFRKN